MGHNYVDVTWDICDGYVSGDRPQHTQIPLDEYLGCENDDERDAIVEDYVGADFQERVSYTIGSVDVPDHGETP